MDSWNIRRKEIDKFFKLKDNQWLKIIFSYYSKDNIWLMSICSADSKRQCNDCMRKGEHSPKVTYGHSTGKRNGIKAFVIALHSLLDFEKTVHNTQINIVGANSRLNNIYKYLTRYGYKIYHHPDKPEVTMMYKKIS